jgi:predicted MPP superfamily phosphohydrolase
LLLDESVTLEKNGEIISLIGVQNISGKSNFHSYGNLEKAYKDSASSPFKILLSHDPSHWDSEVRASYPDIDLTLSGHTHGMQFGVELPWFKWSPVQWMYKQWAGLYEQGEQKLYVNRGFGFIGYPGRVGILPEITLIELV